MPQFKNLVIGEVKCVRDIAKVIESVQIFDAKVVYTLDPVHDICRFLLKFWLFILSGDSWELEIIL